MVGRWKCREGRWERQRGVVDVLEGPKQLCSEPVWKLVKGEQLVEKPRKVAKHLEIGPSGWGPVGLAAVVAVLEEQVKRMVVVVRVVDEVVLVRPRMPASVELLGGPAWEPLRLENELAWDVATREVAVAAEWAESGVERPAVMDGIKS